MPRGSSVDTRTARQRSISREGANALRQSDVDEECRPLYAIEFQGGAHHKGAHATAARDAVKKEALRRAGIGYVEVVAGDTPAELRRVVERLVSAK